MLKADNLNRLVIALFCAFILAQGVSLSAVAAEIPDGVKNTIRQRVNDGLTTGIVVGYFDSQGASYFGYGKTGLPGDQVPDEHNVFEIGSISKTFTALLLADMVLRGEVTLTDPIEKYLPENVKAPRYDGASITLGHLSEHSSGLPRMPGNFPTQDTDEPSADYTRELLYEALSGFTLTRPIGEQFEYSNMGVGLLGHILELATGKSYEQLIVERISTVLGLPDTRIVPTKGMQDRFTEGHVGGARVPHTELKTIAGAGALRSTATDMVAYLQANAGLRDSALHDAMELSHRPRIDAGSSMRNGLGWHVSTTESGREIIWHEGVTGGFISFAGFDKKAQTGAVILTNSAGEGDNDIGFHLLDASTALETRVAPPKVNIELADAVLGIYVGKYSFEASPATILDIQNENGQLSIQVPGQPRYNIYPVTMTRFFMQQGGVKLRFLIGENGKVTGLILSQGAAENSAIRVED